MKKCPYCAEEIKEKAIKCRYCGSTIDELKALRVQKSLKHSEVLENKDFMNVKANERLKENFSLSKIMEDLEKKYITEALKKTSWHRENAARLLGITRKMLGDRIKKYRLYK